MHNEKDKHVYKAKRQTFIFSDVCRILIQHFAVKPLWQQLQLWVSGGEAGFEQFIHFFLADPVKLWQTGWRCLWTAITRFLHRQSAGLKV